MTSLRRFATTIGPFFILGACAQLIGLSDYDTGEVEPQGGSGGEGDESSGGRAGTGVKTGGGGGGGEAGDGTAGVLSTGGRPGRGGTGGDSGTAGGGTGNSGGDTGQGGSTSTGGSSTGGSSTGGSSTGGKGGTSGGAGAGMGGTAGSGASGGSGGSPVCTEVTLSAFITGATDPLGAPASGIYQFEIDPGLGSTSPDLLQLEFWDDGIDFDGAGTGMFLFAPGGQDDNYVSCSRCVILVQDEATTGETFFFQSRGTLNVFPNSTQMSGGAHVEFIDFTLTEVTINTAGVSAPVSGGGCLHLSGSYDMNGWDCSPSWYNDSDCDCGCGRLDPTCTSSSEAACDLCWCNASQTCTPNEVLPTSNWICN